MNAKVERYKQKPDVVITNMYDSEGKDSSVAIIPCSYNEKQQKMNFRAKTD